MDATTMRAAAQGPGRGRAFEFTGTWQEFLPIALTNLLLTVVTLGIYRFWAKARERQYFWSRTRLIDDQLEWTGTGKEMFLGFLMIMLGLILVIALIFLAAFLFTGNAIAKVLSLLLFLAVYGGMFYLTGVAVLRALRYRLSRTYWHGIRGGSNDGGWRYGWEYMWRTWVTAIALFIPLPWAQTRLWNARFNKMSFGQHRFHAEATAEGLFMRWLLVYAVIAGAMAILFLFAASMRGATPAEIEAAGSSLLVIVLVFLAFYVVLPLVALSYFAAYYRRVSEATGIAGLRFRFSARTKDWLLLFLGHVGLVIVTLGIGALFIAYRNYSFAIRHLDLEGEIDVAALTQSSTRSPTDAEGLADAFDIGAI
ncbi:MAG TPA: YjgN family protein [Allosphingosinicella sp.]|nr:YjgN family protein [Allosphingosinicella sp.]